jgi:hypothetical protein
MVVILLDVLLNLMKPLERLKRMLKRPPLKRSPSVARALLL